MIETILRKAKRISSHKDKIVPGQAIRMSEAASVNDYVRQGDLYLVVASAVPRGYAAAERPSAQLVPGATQGARHCLDSLDGVDVFYPPNWGDKYDGLNGPVFVTSRDRTVTHPTHGHVGIPAGFTIQCVYQREWDKELQRARRNAD